MYLQEVPPFQGVQGCQSLLVDRHSPLFQVLPALHGHQVVQRIRECRHHHPYHVTLSVPTTDKEQEYGAKVKDIRFYQ